MSDSSKMSITGCKRRRFLLMSMRGLRYAIIFWGLLNAWLYSCLLPLWEGFDEPFHYGYVETLARFHHLLVMDAAPLPEDIFQSFELAPGSHIVQNNLPQITTFDAWFAFSAKEKARRRTKLEEILTNAESHSQNYEAHQPPLAYFVLSLAENLLQRASLPVRVVWIRVFGATLSVLLLAYGTTELLKTLQMREDLANITLFIVFSSQMLYATITHISNDWLAIPLAVMLFASLASLAHDPFDKRWIWKSMFWLIAGLLTKAYFLAFVPVVLAVVLYFIVKRRIGVAQPLLASLALLGLAGSWYARNVLLYGNITGTQEALRGGGIGQAIRVAPRMDWLAAASFNAHAFLWTGNNSFTTFSTTTLNLMLLLLAAAFFMWISRPKFIRLPEAPLVASVMAFVVALAYAAAASYAQSGGTSRGASPWYSTIILVPIIALGMLGTSRVKRLGPICAGATVLVWSYVLLATWTVKLFPMYSGMGDPPMRIRTIWDWYVHRAMSHMEDLSATALVPAPLLYAGLVLVVIVTLWLVILVLRIILQAGHEAQERCPEPDHPA